MPTFPRGKKQGVRWNAEMECFTMRCDDCYEKSMPSHWPLTLEFWNKRNLQRCKACEHERDLSQKRLKYANDPVYREERKAERRRYFQENKHTEMIKHVPRKREWERRKREAQQSENAA